ncbi:MAG: hypothetical protein IK083_05150 [Abditibacteriota bacterium]|nr:hypothetical protein [Abditibacteriota bacterium]
MTSKERVRRTFGYEEADRVPRNYLANAHIDRRLKARLGLEPEDTEGLLRALGVDFRTVGLAYTGPRLHPEEEGRLVDPCYGVRCRWIPNEYGGYMDYCDFPLAGLDTETALRWPMPDPEDFDYRAFGEACRQAGEYYVCYVNMPDVINATGMIMGMEQTLIGLATDDRAVLTYIDRRLETQLENLRRALAAAGGALDCLWTGEDLGTQHAPLISPELFERHIRPRHQPFIDAAREAGAAVMMHSCGSSSWAFEAFIDMGVDVVDTLQPEAADMSPRYLRDRFAPRLAFHGSISTAMLAEATPAQVREICRDTVRTYGRGYALAPTHMLQDNTPVDNALAMYDAGPEGEEPCREKKSS